VRDVGVAPDDRAARGFGGAKLVLGAAGVRTAAGVRPGERCARGALGAQTAGFG